jgi:hypothetical protein
MFDRKAHCQRIGAHGGSVTAQRHGSAHMRMIGKAGARATIDRHGVAYFQGLVKRKGWSGRRRESVTTDLAAGRVLAALAASLVLAVITTPDNASAREHFTESTPPVACQHLIGWEDGSSVCQFGAAYWSYDPDTETYTVIERPTVYLRVGVPVHGK